jgi:hypothetical protein
MYGAAFAWLLRPIRKVEREADHLREIETKGDSGETPFIAILGLIFFLLPIGAVMMLLAFGAAWLFRLVQPRSR